MYKIRSNKLIAISTIGLFFVKISCEFYTNPKIINYYFPACLIVNTLEYDTNKFIICC